MKSNNINEKVLFEAFMQILEQNGLTQADIRALTSMIKQKTLNKGDFFCKVGKKHDEIGILISGLMLAYHMDEKGNQIVSRFYCMPELAKNPVVTSFKSFKLGTNCEENIKALDVCHIFTINKLDLEKIYEKIPQFNKLGRELAENSYIDAIERIRDLQNLDAQEIVEKFHKDYKCLIGRVQINQIASYLGINRRSYATHSKRVLKKMGNITHNKIQGRVKFAL